MSSRRSRTRWRSSCTGAFCAQGPLWSYREAQGVPCAGVRGGKGFGRKSPCFDRAASRRRVLAGHGGIPGAPLPEAVPEPGEPQKAQRAQKGVGVGAEVGGEGDAWVVTPSAPLPATASPTKGRRTAESSIVRGTAAPKVDIKRAPDRYRCALGRYQARIRQAAGLWSWFTASVRKGTRSCCG